MNHLAHFHLSWPTESLIVGALEGDFHRGSLPGELNPFLVEGVALHRAVDGFTDRHPMLDQARAAFPEGTRRYAGIMMDLSFDYFLARHWSAYSDLPLEAFTEQVYGILERATGELSHPARRAAAWLMDHDVLTRYRHWPTVIAAAERVGERLNHDNPLHRAADILNPLADELEQTFLQFYPELIRFSLNNAKLATPQQNTQGAPD